MFSVKVVHPSTGESGTHAPDKSSKVVHFQTGASNQYPKLTTDDVKALVVENKWITTLDKEIHGELDRISQSLASRIKELAERYESALPELVEKVSTFESKVNKHLEKMGFVWN